MLNYRYSSLSYVNYVGWLAALHLCYYFFLLLFFQCSSYPFPFSHIYVMHFCYHPLVYLTFIPFFFGSRINFSFHSVYHPKNFKPHLHHIHKSVYISPLLIDLSIFKYIIDLSVSVLLAA